jgi:hypothetical protein
MHAYSTFDSAENTWFLPRKGYCMQGYRECQVVISESLSIMPHLALADLDSRASLTKVLFCRSGRSWANANLASGQVTRSGLLIGNRM